MYYITPTLPADPKKLNLIHLCTYATFKYCSQKFYGNSYKGIEYTAVSKKLHTFLIYRKCIFMLQTQHGFLYTI